MGTSKKSSLEQAFAVFLHRFRIGNNPSPHTHLGSATLEHQGANGHVENGRAPGRNKNDGSGIDAARIPLYFSDDLHGANLGSAGNGATGKHAPKDVVVADSRSEYP